MTRLCRPSHISVAVLALLVALVACSRKDDQRAQRSEDPFGIHDTLVDVIPVESAGFVHWNTAAESYRRYRSSAWGQRQHLLADLPSSPNMKRFVEFLKQVGIDASKPQDFDAALGEGVIFGIPDGETTKGGFGLLIAPSKSGTSKMLGEAIKRELEGGSVPLESVSLPGASAIGAAEADVSRFLNGGEEEGPVARSSNTRLYLAWNEEHVALATAQNTVGALIAGGQQKEKPRLLSSPSLRRAAAESTPAGDRYLIGVVDVASMLKNPALRDLHRQGGVNNLKPEEFPIEGAVIAAGFRETPFSEGRLLFQPKTESQKALTAGIGTVASPEILAAIPARPLLFLNIDGNVLRNIAQHTAGQGGAAGNPILSRAQEIRNLGLSLRVGPVGQSILPVPDMLITIESSSPEQLVEQIAASTAPFLGQVAPGATWSERTVAGTKAKMVASGMGMSVFLAAKGKLVVAASTEAQMSEALTAIGNGEGPFLKTVSDRARDALSRQPSVVGMYLNLVEVGRLLENMGSLLSTFAPSGPAGPFTPEDIQAIKKLGALVTSVSLKEDTFVVRSQYEPLPAAAG